MARLKQAQNSFNKGIIHDHVRARSDLDMYFQSCQTATNYLILPQGGLLKRKGFKYIATEDDAVKLTAFSFSGSQEYVFVWHNTALKIYRSDTKVWDSSTHVSVYGDRGATYTNGQTIDINSNTVTLSTGTTVADAVTDITAAAIADVQADSIDGRLRIHTGTTGTSLVLAEGGGTALADLGFSPATYTTTDIPWTTAQIQEFRWAQSFDTLWIAHEDVAVHVIQRNGANTDWLVYPYYFSTYPQHDFGSGAEDAWSATRGYPRTVTLHQNRLIIGGSRDLPQTIWGSQTGDYPNFDVGTSQDDESFAFTLGSAKVNTIKDIVSIKSLQVFTHSAEFIMEGSPVTPGNVNVVLQTQYGTGNVRPLTIDVETLFVTEDGKSLRAFVYELERDSHIAKNYTMLAHDILTTPTEIVYLTNYINSQSNYVFCVNSDGTLSVCALDVEREVLGWTTLTTETDHTFTSCTVVDDALYAIVNRDGTEFLEKMTEDEVYLDAYLAGTDDPAKTSWTGATHLANETVQIVADGFAHDDVAVDGSGNFTTDSAVSSVEIGWGYTATIETNPIALAINGNLTRGERMRKIQCWVHLQDTKDLTVDGYLVTFRKFGTYQLGDPLVAQDGMVNVRLKGYGREPTVTIQSTNPFSQTIIGLITQVKVAP